MIGLKLPKLIKDFNKLTPNEFNNLFGGVNEDYQYGQFEDTSISLADLKRDLRQTSSEKGDDWIKRYYKNSFKKRRK